MEFFFLEFGFKLKIIGEEKNIAYCELEYSECFFRMRIPSPLFIHPSHNATFMVSFITSTTFGFSFPAILVLWGF